MSIDPSADRAKNHDPKNSRAAERAERLSRLRATALCTVIENPVPRGLPPDEPAIVAGGSPCLEETVADMALPLAQLSPETARAAAADAGMTNERRANDAGMTKDRMTSDEGQTSSRHADVDHSPASPPPASSDQQPSSPPVAQPAGPLFRFDAAEGISPRAPLAMPAFTLAKQNAAQQPDAAGQQPQETGPSPYPVGELYRQLRQNVLGNLAPGQAATVWICPTGTEPLSDHLVELASALAEGCDGEILLVDANFQAASLTRRFNLGEKSGLADVLAKKLAPHAAGHETAVARVRVLPKGGDTVGRASRRANEDEWRSLLAGLKERYRYVLIDAPGIEEPHCLPLAKAADAAFVAIALDHTPRETVQEALEHLHLHKARVAGCVITDAPV